jgi:hypothetical protein
VLSHVPTFSNFKKITIILKQFKMFNFYSWKVLDCDTWCNRNLPHDIYIRFVQNKFKSIFKYVDQTK